MRFPAPARAALAAGLLLFSAAAAAGHEGAADAAGPGIDERLGAVVPLDTAFRDEQGGPVRLAELAGVPMVLSFVYYRCPNACDFLLTGIADVLREVPAVPGRDFRVITISVDPKETAADAQKAKRIGIESVQGPFPPDAWRFLTGDEGSIDAVADAVGFRFTSSGDDFDHPLGLVILSPRGKVVRYMNGAAFLPADLKMSLLEASTGTIGPTIGKVLRFCFRVDPQGRTLVFNTLKVTAVVTLTLAAAFVLYLVLSARAKAARARQQRAPKKGRR
jgi:protein SCO1